MTKTPSYIGKGKGGYSSKYSKTAVKKQHKKRVESFKSYIYKTLKEDNSEFGISTKTIMILNSFMEDMFSRISEQASKLAKMNGRQTIGVNELIYASKSILPEGIFGECNYFAETAVNKIEKKGIKMEKSGHRKKEKNT